MKRLLLLLTLALLTFVISTAFAHDHGVHVRVVHLSPSSPAVDVYVGETLAIRSLGFKQTSGYLAIDGNRLDVALVVAGGDLADAVYSDTLVFAGTETGYFTVVAFGDLSDLTFELFVLPEDAQPLGSASADNLVVRSAFARPTSTGGMGHGHGHGHGHGNMGGSSMGGVSAAYMVIENNGAEDDVLVSATSDVAGRIELHESVITGDMAQMGEVEGGIVVSAQSIAELRPGGLHIMLMDLKQELVEGSTIPLTLTFASGITITLDVPVRTP